MSKLAALVLLALTSACSAPRLEIMPRAIQFNIDGNFKANSGGFNTDNSLESLGIDDNPVVFAPRVDLSVGALDITADYFSVSYSGSGTVEQDIEFGGQTFPATTDVNSELELSLARVAATLDFIPTDTFDLGLGVGAAFADARMFVQEQTLLNSAQTDQQAPFPFAAGRAKVALGSLSAEVLVGWLEFNYEDVDASYLDVDAMLRWAFLGGNKHLSGALLAGYRYTSVDISYTDGSDDIRIDAQLSGPYLGLSLAF